MAHPIRPDSYIEINNFYTTTVYEKGAEVVRMIHTLLGAEGYRKGIDLYFERHDGQAVTCDDFVAAMEDATGKDLVRDLSLDLRAGEILCIYGLMGAGRTELLETCAGRLQATGGEIVLEGQEISHLSIGERIARGLALVPEDRQRDGLVQTMSVGQNLSLASIRTFTRGLFTSSRAERKLVDDSIRSVTVKTSGGSAPIGSLSGGNQQKVVIGKMLATNPRVIMLDEPSRGIDIGAKAEVFRLLAEGARRGLAVIYSTSEVSECLSIAHRIIVMHKGRISAEFDSTVSKEKIMAASGESVAA